ncbi:hypothetical protein ACIF8Z_15515 [Pseudomonas promysalinigenes]|uniref:hypothetical protein n=1 Tax=Pseudomonas promysalinigenes TaxID=485898 RepID=UPI0037CA4120
MQTRFVVVPALPPEKDYLPKRAGFAQVLGAGYDLYDTRDKLRVTLNCATRAEADYACACRNGLIVGSDESLGGGQGEWRSANT